jgi:GTP-binding protein EngB required for normal cell division
MAQKQPSMNKSNASSDTISLTAIDPSGHLGSYYDGYRDGVFNQLVVRDEDKLSALPKTIQCQLKKGDKSQNGKLLKLINMHEELRLSVLLRSELRNGIASIIDYPHQVDECTRFLCYNYVHQKEQISDQIMKIRKMDKSCTPSAATTHIITGVNYGIDVVVALQLPSLNEVGKSIDDVLERICVSLNNDQDVLALISDNEQLLKEITDTTVYSNIPCLMEMSTLREVCSYIDTNKSETMNYPIIYILRPIKWMFPEYMGHGVNFTSTPSAVREKIEQYLIEFSNTLENLKYTLDVTVTKRLGGNLDKQLCDAQHQLSNLNKTYVSTVERLQNLIFEIHKNRSKESTVDQTLKNIKDKTSKDIKELTQLVKQLDEKGQVIIDLEKKNFKYRNAVEHHVSEKDNDQTWIRKLRKNNRPTRIFCTNDQLNKKNQRKYTEHRRQLIEERKANSDLEIVYADFTYCSFELNAMTIPTLKLSKTNKKKNETARKPTPPSPKTKTSALTTDEFINILLLGETGVGKSTFINAFVNYLTSETFERAQSNEPVVLIPVSFLLTTGNNFDEHIVKFGDFVSSHNEDFDNPGESVTQHCKSYEFHLNRDDGKKLRIIDTPGFGDTRGLGQDDLNMEDILKYINTLTHLNAVCFLLKPNASEIHTFFRMCFTQLIDLLGPSVRENIIFCFTNARSTFYTPGDTAPLLKTMLKSLSMNDIPFKQENTYCFDNEAFRYLVALKNNIQFNDDEEHDYKMSWSNSVKQSNRLINYICTQLDVCSMDNQWKSIKHAQIEVIHMIRPMLEAMRNILRNIILCKIESTKKSIKLSPKPIHRPGAICSLCTPYPIRVGNFWIIREITHEFRKKCFDCSCPTDQHVQINYILYFEDSDTPQNYQQKEMIDMAYRLCLAGAEFDYFLSHVSRSSKDDPFWIGLMRMIDEENDLCKNQKPNRLNSQLFKDLNELKCQYEERIENLKLNPQQTALPNIYKWITSIREYPTIQEQLDAIKETQTMMTEPYEISQD